MQAWTSPTGRLTTLELEGEWDLSRASRLRFAVLTALDNPHLRLLVVDLRHVTFMDVAVISCLALAARRCLHHDVGFLLLQPSLQVAKVLKLTGLQQFVHSEEAASLDRPKQFRA